MSGEAASKVSQVCRGFVKWCRRGSAVLVTFFLLRWLLYGTPPTLELRSWLAVPLRHLTRLPEDRALIAVIVAWYAFLTQLKIRWALWLPIYLAFFPLVWTFWRLFLLIGAPAVGYLKSVGESTVASVPATSKAYRSFPKKRVWLAAFFVWLVVFRGLNVSWAAWIPPFLALPIWFFFLRLCYQCAVTPRTVANSLVTLCSNLLDAQIKLLNEAREKKTKPAIGTITYKLANAILRRYSDDRVVSMVQKESLTLFSVSLLLALAASSGFWGLVAIAVMHSTDALAAYGFFNSGSWFEASIWAWGCMTTAISFPGAASPTWLKAVHASILATGLFQLTYLLACFSIMTSTEGMRTASEAKKALQVAREKLEEMKALEASVVVIEVADTDTKPPLG
jgi:hypothetical protein